MHALFAAFRGFRRYLFRTFAPGIAFMLVNVSNKNIKTMLKTDYKFGEAFPLALQVEKDDSKVGFRDIMNNGNGGIALLAFTAGQELAKHLAPAEVMVYILEGEIVFTMIDRPVKLRQGDAFLMGDGVPHSVKAATDAKVMLVKIKHD